MHVRFRRTSAIDQHCENFLSIQNTSWRSLFHCPLTERLIHRLAPLTAPHEIELSCFTEQSGSIVRFLAGHERVPTNEFHNTIETDGQWHRKTQTHRNRDAWKHIDITMNVCRRRTTWVDPSGTNTPTWFQRLLLLVTKQAKQGRCEQPTLNKRALQV